MNPVHALRGLKWWYRTTFNQWFEGPEYADCPDCDGQVYHYHHGSSPFLIKYQCRECSWSKLGTGEFEFYEDQRPGTAAWEMFCTYSALITEHGPDERDPAAYAEWLESGGHETLTDELAGRYDEDDFREAVRDLERVRADG